MHGIKKLFLLCFLYAPGLSTQAQQPLCALEQQGMPERPALSDPPESGKIYLDAEQALFQEDSNRAFFEGNVLLQRGSQILRADHVLHNHASGETEALGGVAFWDEGFAATADYVRLKGEDNQANATGARYWLLQRRGRGAAESIERTGEDTVVLHRGTYTTCDVGAEAWHLEARRTELDFASNKGVSRDVLIRFENLPVFYTPYISYPISEEPKSGLLAPRIGSSNDSGVEFSIPYYWRIAPNYDVTFTPRIMTKRGAGLDTEFRYLFPSSGGRFNLEYWPNDDVYGGDRSYVNFRHSTRFSKRLRTALLYQETSDNLFFQDFGNTLDLSSTVHLERYALLNYHGRGWTGLAKMQDYQSLSANPAARPYQRMPQILLRSNLPQRNRRVNFKLRGELVNFAHDVSSAAHPTAWRSDLKGELSYPLHGAAAFFEPTVYARYTSYNLDYGENAADVDDTLSRFVGGGSIDSGLFFERDVTFGGRALIQTLEPRLFYQYTPYKAQDELPVFDTAAYSLSWGRMFRDDSFSGPDRVDDQHSLTTALSTRFLGFADGWEYFRAGIGRIYYFRDRRVTLPRQTTETGDSSDIIAEAALQGRRGWNAAYTLQWREEDSNSVYHAARLRYQPDKYKVINLSYRYREALLEQSDISWAYPVGRRWRALGRWNYSQAHNKTLETFLGVEYHSCCWAVRTVARRYLQNARDDYHMGFYLQLELKGLAGLGRSTGHFLSERIAGFEDDLE